MSAIRLMLRSASLGVALTLALVANAAAREAAAEPAERRAVELCRTSAAADCPFAHVGHGDHYYVFPHPDRERLDWRAVCSARGHPGERGVPDDYLPDLKLLMPGVLQHWVAADGPLNQPFIRTITFCGFRLTDILELDWSATNARIRFYMTEITRTDVAGADEPQGIFPSRGLFSSGLTIDRSVLTDGAEVRDMHFGSFVEIERSVIELPFVARNTVVEGALRLRDNRFAQNLRLEALEVAGDTILADNSFPAQIAAAVVEPDGTAGSVVRLRELRLRGVLQVTDNEFAGIAQATHDAAAKDPLQIVSRSFYLQKSIVSDNDVTIATNSFAGHVFLVDVEGKRLSIARNAFDGILHITGSDFFAVRTFHNDFNSFLQLRSNQLGSSLIIDRDTFWGDEKRIEIIGNEIAQEMRIAPRRLPPEGSTLTLTHNRVTGPADLYLPLGSRHLTTREADFRCDAVNRDDPHPERDGFERWRGTVDLTGSQFASSLMIAESCYDGPTAAMTPIVYRPRYVEEQLPRWRAEAPCREAGLGAAGVGFNFSLATAALLTLHVMPGGCHYVWRGTNLDFGYFGTSYEGQLNRLNGDGEQAGYDRETDRQLLQAWLRNLDADDPSVYLRISGYLRDRGDFNGSRKWLAAAKEAIYRPDSRPRPLVSASAQDDPPPPDQVAWKQWLEQQVVYWALWPAGYGAMPERAIWSLGFVWVLSWVVYWLHWRGWINSAYIACRHARAGNVRTSLGAAAAAQAAWRDERRRLAALDVELTGKLTSRHGFVVVSDDREDRRFSLGAYALDATLPIIPLGRFGVFVPDNAFVRGISYFHHMLAWWLGALFIGALTIL